MVVSWSRDRSRSSSFSLLVSLGVLTLVGLVMVATITFADEAHSSPQHPEQPPPPSTEATTDTTQTTHPVADARPLPSPVSFPMRDGLVQCFYEDLPERTRVVATFDVPELEDIAPVRAFFRKYPALKKAVGIHGTVKNPRGQVFVDQVTDRRGKLAFRSQYPGEHTICFSTNTTSWWPSQKREFRLYVSIERGEHAQDYDLVAKKDHLDTVELAIRRLRDRVNDIFGEQSHFMWRDSENSGFSESLNSSAFWYGMSQLTLAVIVAIAQLYFVREVVKDKED